MEKKNKNNPGGILWTLTYGLDSRLKESGLKIIIKDYCSKKSKEMNFGSGGCIKGYV